MTSKFCPQGAVYPCPVAIYKCIKSYKKCIKSDFKDIFLKLATDECSDKTFLLTSKLCPMGAVCPCPGLYTVHAAKCYDRSRFSANEKRITFLVKPLQNPRSSHDIFTLTFRSYRDHNALRENFALEEYARLTLQQVNQGHVKFSPCAFYLRASSHDNLHNIHAEKKEKKRNEMSSTVDAKKFIPIIKREINYCHISSCCLEKNTSGC